MPSATTNQHNAARAWDFPRALSSHRPSASGRAFRDRTSARRQQFCASHSHPTTNTHLHPRIADDNGYRQSIPAGGIMMRVLVVEDDKIRQLVKASLEIEGYSVLTGLALLKRSGCQQCHAGTHHSRPWPTGR